MNRTSPKRPLPIALVLSIVIVSSCAKTGPPSFQGYVEGDFVHVGAGVAGRLEHLLVGRGQTVEANAPLFTLESKQEAALVKQADEATAAASAQLSDLETGKRAPELEVVRAQLAQATASEQRSASQLTRDEAQFAAGGISRTQLDEIRAKHEVDAARLREIRSQLAVAEMAARPAQIRAQSSQVEAARAQLAQASWRLDEKHIAAAQAGLIVDTLFREGEWVPAGAAVVRLLPPANVKIRFFVPEPDLGQFAVGRSLSIHLDGSDKPIEATVSYVSSEAEFTPPVIYSNDMRAKLVFMIEARVSEAEASQLHPGQPVSVRLR